MKGILLSLKQVFRNTLLVISLSIGVGLLALSAIATQPAFAATGTNVTPAASNTATQQQREDAYEQAAKAASSPESLEKAYEEDLEEYKDAHPGETGIIGEAKDIVEKVTGQE